MPSDLWKSVLPPRRKASCRRVASKTRLEPSTFFPRISLVHEMRSCANADDFKRIPNPVEAEVANLKFSGGSSRGR